MPLPAGSYTSVWRTATRQPEASRGEAGRLALQDDVQRGGISSATIPLRQAAALAVRLGTPAFDAAVLAEALTAGSVDGVGKRRLNAIAALTRHDSDVLVEAMDHVPTGIASLAATPDAATVVRDVLVAAKYAADGAARLGRRRSSGVTWRA